MEIMVQVIVLCITGGIAAAIASSKGRSTVGWFFGGFFLGIIGIIIVAVLPNLKQQERLRTQAMAERRRLREQLRQEKMKTESFRQHASGRLDAHDRTLGVDTRRSPELAGPAPRPKLAGGAPRRVVPRARGPADPGGGGAPGPEVASEVTWYYESNGESKGPVAQSTLAWMLENGSVTAATLVWTEGQADWLPASQVQAFRGLGPA